MWGKPVVKQIKTEGCEISVTFMIQPHDHDIVIPKGTELQSTQYDMAYVLPEDIVIRCEPETLPWYKRIWYHLKKIWSWIWD